MLAILRFVVSIICGGVVVSDCVSKADVIMLACLSTFSVIAVFSVSNCAMRFSSAALSKVKTDWRCEFDF